MNTKSGYNTITTPRGTEYQLILSDGSKVWLNSTSSIRFPRSFDGSERKVEITGEVYFEVVNDTSRPFKVGFKSIAGGTGIIEVNGTSFNVNAYYDENEIKITLLEGFLKIKKENKSLMLSSGEQVVLTSDSIRLKKDVTVSIVKGWIEGFFIFDKTDIKSVMRQVARWYDVEVNFQSKLSRHVYSGKISRNIPLPKFLEVFQFNDLNITTEGRKVIIKEQLKI